MTQRIDPFAVLDPCAALLLRQTLRDADLAKATLPRHAGLVRALRTILARDAGTGTNYQVLRDSVLAASPDLRPHVKLLEHCANRLADILSGAALASDVLFPGGGMDLVEPVYRGNRWSDHFNHLTARAVTAAVRARREQAPDAPVRLLEVGAGTGGTSAAVLAALDAHADCVTYDYTDVSIGFVQHGRRTFGTGRPYLSGRVLDLERAPDAQGFEVAEYDIVIATNVLHATTRIATSLSHVAALLRPGGLLLLNEITRAGAFATMTFGLLDGWWAFRDPELRLPDAPVLSPDGWRSALAAQGFGTPAVIGWTDPPEQSFQCLFVAERQGASAAVSTPVVAPAPAPVARTAPSSGLCDLLAERLAGLLGLDASELAADRPFAEFGVDSIIAPQFVGIVNRDLGASLVPTDIFDHATLQRLAARMQGMSLRLPEPVDAAPVEMPIAEPAIAPPAVRDDAVAVIGLSCRFPGAEDVEAFWANILAGHDAITEVPRDRWDGAADGRTRWGGFLAEHDCFDPEFFNLSWREAEAMSPQQRVFLEQAWNALENAGYGRRGLSGARCGVFVGAAPDGYGINENDSLSSLGGSLAILAARISYLLDLKGPSLPLDTACSSSLVAVHLACQSILGGDCDMALAGGVSILMTDPRLHSFLGDAGMLSPTGRCHTFDAKADGFVPGEGVGVVVLKRLDRALADGDAIIGVIRASGINQDGRSSGITAPNGPSQTALELAVYDKGGIDPAEITLVEAHGTGTRLGDPIEVNALATAFRKHTDRTRFCALGSVKTNIGHTLTAAGVAGLIKVLLAIRHRTILPTLHFADRNPLIGLDESPFFVPTQPTPWSAPVLLGAVSSFGFSGTNAHLVVAEPPVVNLPPAAEGPVLIPLSARTAEALAARRADLLRWLGDHSPRLVDLAFTLSQGRGHFEYRSVILVHSLDDLRAWRGQEWRADGLVLPARGGEDAALAAALSDPARDLVRIAESYVAGGDADWTPLFPATAHRLTLPGYRFARQRFPTRSRVAAAAPPSHPMLGARERDGFPLRLDADTPWLRDHRFNGSVVFPAAGYVEAVRAALEAWGRGGVLTDLRFANPIVVRSGSSARIAIQDDDTGTSFAVVGSDGQEHARGRVDRTPNPAGAATDVTAVRAALPQVFDRDTIYARFRDLGFDYGPSLRVIRSLRTDGTSVLAELAPAQAANPALHVDPALLDGAVQAAIGLMLGGSGSFGQVVPIGVGRVIVHAPLRDACVAHVRLLTQEGDTRHLGISVLDPAGNPVVTLQDVAVRVRPASTQAEPVTFCAPVWEPAPLPPADPPKALLLFDRDEAVWRALGMTPVLVRPGSAFCRLDARCFAIDPDSRSDHDRLLATLRDDNLLPDAVWHLWSRRSATPQSPADATAADLRAIFLLTGALARQSPIDPVSIVHLCGGSEATTQAAVAGFAASVARENPLLRLVSVAMDGHDAGPLIQRLAAETDSLWRKDAPADQRAVRWADDGGRMISRLHPVSIQDDPTLVWPNQPVILLTGALGGIGRHVARHVAARHRARLVLIGRSAEGPDSRALIADVRAAGGDAVYVSADMADSAGAESAVAAARARFGRIDAVLHAAGARRDGYLLNQTTQDLAAVLAPKLAGTVALARATAGEDLVCFACFSSVAGWFGNAGQGAYAAANRFQDAYMATRAGPGRSLSIAWPYWRDGGMSIEDAELQRREAAFGLRALETDAGLAILDRLLGGATGTVAVLPGTAAALDALTRPQAPAPAPAAITAGDAVEAAILYLRALLARATAMPEERIHPDRPLEQYGIDSLLVTTLNDDLARDFPGLPKTLFFEHQTLRSAATFLAHRHGQALEAHLRPAPVETPSPQPDTPAPRRADAPGQSDVIAIIGIAGRYPGANSLEQFWANLCADRDLITEIPPDRWNAAAWHDPRPGMPGRSYSRWGGFLSDIDQFDPLFFNIAPGEAAAIDPNERLFLEVCWEALENSGHTRASLARDADRSVGVYAGVMYGEYQLLAADQARDGRAVGGSSPYWSIANRVSYHLDVHGPSLAVDSACSSSLTAIHLACQAIASGECSAAIAGGVNLSLHPLKYVGLSQGRFAATDGRCHSFAAGGDGYVPGEGVGAVVLKPLSAALADGDFVHAVIRGWATNHGGKTNGYTVPNPVQQAGVIGAAFRRGGIAPETVSYIEAHGTGTALGDPIEVAGLAAAFGDAVPRQSCALGSVKANIGHLEAAAGIAGLTRVVLQLRHRTLTPTHRHGPPNPNIDFAATPFRLQQVTEAWTGPLPLRAGISSFGAGGANAHLVVEAFETTRANPATSEPALFVLSARTDVQLRAYAAVMAGFLRACPYSLADVCRTLQRGREPMAARLAFVATSLDGARERLERFLNGEDDAVSHGILDDGMPGQPVPQNADLEALATGFVAGAAVDWARLDLPGQTVPVPVHPYMRRRCWLESAAADPVCDRIIPSLDGVTAEKRFLRSSPLIRDHVVRGRFLVPGVAQLAVVRAALSAVGEPGLRLHDITWTAPLEVAEDGTVVRATLRREGDEVTFQVQLADGDVVCRGRAGAAVGTVSTLDIGAIRNDATRHLAQPEIYPRLAALGVAYGDSLRVLTDIWTAGDRMVAAVAPTRDEVAVLDAALQSLLGFAADTARDLLVPFALGALHMHRPLAEARFIVATRQSARADLALFDAAICDATGAVLAGLSDIAARPIATDQPLPLTIRVPAWVGSPPPGARPAEAQALLAHTGDDLGLTARFRLALGAQRVRDVRIGGPPERDHAERNVTACEPRDKTMSGSALTASGQPESALALPDDVSDLVWIAAPPAGVGEAEAAETMAIGLLRVVRGLDAQGRLSAGLRLRIVTRNLQSLDPRARPDPSPSALVGLAKCVAQEYPRVAVTLADFDDASLGDPRIADMILAEPAAVPAREVAWRDGVRHVQAMRPITLAEAGAPLRPGSVVLIVGGAGGIGTELAAWLARDCSARVALVGRRPEREVADRIAAIPAGAGTIRYFQADATDPAAMRQVVAHLRAIWGGVDVAIHAALVLRDRTLARMDEPTFREVIAPKIAGSVAMVEALATEAPRLVVFLSSINVVSGSLGQANYVAGSSFVDAYARAVAARHPWRVVVTDWGLWGDVGVVSAESYLQHLGSLGVHPIQPQEGVATLAAILGSPHDRVAIIRADAKALQRLGLTEADPEPEALGSAEADFAVLERYGRVAVHAILADMAGQPNKAWTTEGLRRRLGVAPRHNDLFLALLQALADDDLVASADGLWRFACGVDIRAAAAALDAATVRSPWLAGARRLLQACIDAYPAVLRGDVDPVSVLFPDGAMTLVEAAYTANPIADRFNQAVGEAARAHSDTLPPGAPIRIIELGAGTGSTTAPVLAALAPLGARVNYLATDLSQRFLAHGSGRFSGDPRIRFAIHDAEKDPEANGRASGGFDIVIAANVLHATADLVHTLSRVRRLLAPGGVLLLSEATRAQDFGTMVFGLTPGWWLAQDRDRRLPHAPLASVASWQDSLREAGFAEAKALALGDAATSPHSLLVATNRQAFVPAAEPLRTPPAAHAVVAEVAPAATTRLVAHLRRVLADVLKTEPDELRLHEGFDRYGLESLTALEIRNRLDRDIPGLPATLLFEHNTLARLATWLAQTHPDAVHRLVGDQPAITVAPPVEAPPAVVATPVPVGAIRDEPIAIIGHAGRYPGGPTSDAFWNLLRAGDSAIREVPPDRWDAATIFDAAGAEGHSYSRWAGFIDGVDRFDPLFFNISPLDAEVMDPQERLFLETAWVALEQAGYTPRRLRELSAGPDGGDVGVFVGAMNVPYQWVAAEAWAAGQPNAASTNFWSIANRVSYLLDFSGPSMVVDTACSASLTAIHLACESLRRGECGAALAGGVNLILHPRQFINLSQARMISRGAECRAFGEGADGFVDGEGVGAVLLKPLSAARRDGDRIEGVILASAVNAGGRTSGFTVPSPQAQARVIRSALRRAGVGPETITYVEAHGTGTALGDPIEIAGLTEALGGDGGGARCAIGAVKANIGHLESAAGIAGLTKVLLQLRHRTIAPTRHAATPNPLLDLSATRFVLPTEPLPWQPATEGGLLRAGLSSFGAGGANAHLVIEEYPAPDVAVEAVAGPDLVVLSARDDATLRQVAGDLLAVLRRDRPRLVDVGHTLRLGREAMAARLAIVAADGPALEAAIQAWLDGQAAPGLFVGKPGSGSSARALAETEEGQALLAGLLDRRELGRLAQLWVEGADITWTPLSSPHARLLPLPTYPFRRDRYWLPAASRAVVDEATTADPGPTAEPAAAEPVPAEPVPAEPTVTDQAGRTAIFRRIWRPAAIQGQIDPMPVLVMSRDRRLISAFRQAWAAPVRVIEPGEGFAIGDAETFRMDPASEADHAALIAHVARTEPDGFAIVQALDWEDGRESDSPLASILLTQAAQRAGVTGVRILHVFAGADDRPLDQAVGSLARSSMQESDGCRLRAVGIADPLDLPAIAAICRDELRANDDAPEVRYHDAARQTPGIEAVAGDPDAATISFRIGGAYLLVGGLGEVGCAIAERLGRDYRARIAIIGRSDPRGPALERLRALRDAGIQVHYEACDLTDRAGLDQALARIRDQLGRLHGVLHLARTVEDALLVRKSAASVQRVMAAKVAGTITLDAALAREELDWFVLCSSLAAWLGLAGGGDYALACAFQSGFSRLRQQAVERGERSGRTVAICWPQWRHDRYLNDAKLRRLAAEGLQTIDARDGLRIIAQALQSGCTEVAAVKGSERALARVPLAYRQDTMVVASAPVPAARAEDETMAELAGLTDAELAAYVDYLSVEPERDTAPPSAMAAPRPRAEPPVAPVEVVVERVPRPPVIAEPPEQAVLDTVCEFLKLPRDRFDEASEFAAFGMDSIKALHVAERLQKRLGVTVDPAMFYEFPTVAALAGALADRTAGRSAGGRT